jgi:filamin
LNIKPQEPGRHSLTIKYGGEHVPGSAFALRVAGAPDPSKVRVYGPGIEHGVLATFQSRFICDTRGAGAGQLTVRVRGPKGAFRVEMQRESQKDRTILCKVRLSDIFLISLLITFFFNLSTIQRNPGTIAWKLNGQVS